MKASDFLNEKTENSASDFLDSPDQSASDFLGKSYEEEPRTFIKGATKDLVRGTTSIGHGLMKGAQSFWGFFDDAATLVSKITGWEKGGLFKELVKIGEPPEDWTPENLSEKIISGISQAPSEIGLITALPGSAPVTMGYMGAIRGGAKGGWKEAGVEAAKGALLGKILQGAGYITKPWHAPTIGGIFGIQAAAEGGDAEQIAEATAVGFGLGLAGGKARDKKSKKPKEIESDVAAERFKDEFIKEESEPENIAKEIPYKSAKESAMVFESVFNKAQSIEGKELLKKQLREEQQQKGYEPEFGDKLSKLRNEEKINKQVEKDFEKFGRVTLYSGIPFHKMGEFWTNTIGEIVWDRAIMKGVPKILEKVPGGKTINRALLREYRGDLENTDKYIESMDDMKIAQSIGREYAIDLGNRLQSFSEESQLKMGEYIRGEDIKLEGKELDVANEAKSALYDLGKQSVDAGLLGEDIFFKNAGRYMPRLYTSKEYQSLLSKFNLKKPNKLDLSRFKKRKDIPEEIRREMGEILTPGYPVAKGITQLTHDIAMAKWFDGISRNPEWSAVGDVVPEGFKQLPENKKLGRLSKKYVHPEIFEDISETIRIIEAPERVWRKALGTWKFGKVIMSPKTHMRNMMSNSILAHLGGMPMTSQPYYLTKAAKEMKFKGGLWKEAKQHDLLSSTFTNAELRDLFNIVEMQMSGIKAESIPEKLGIIGDTWNVSKNLAGKAAKLYEAEEQIFKMAKFIHNKEKLGMDSRSAAKDAEKWLFNYSKLTKFQEKYRSKWYGAPFATFTFKAIPRIAESAIKTPWRFALPASIIYGIEKAASEYIGDTEEQRKAKKKLTHEWQQGSFFGIPNFARVPIVDDNGREYYLNLSYILPWGDIGESGGFGFMPGSLVPMSQPFVKEGWQQIANYDSFWKEQIVKEEDIAGMEGAFGKSPENVLNPLTEAGREALKIRGQHLAQTMVPTPFIDIQKAYSALKEIPDYRGRERPKSVVSADILFGVKMYGVDYAEQIRNKIMKVSPKKGRTAQRIVSEIRTLKIKQRSMKKKGKDTRFLEEQMVRRIGQLNGLADDTKELQEQYYKYIGR